MSVIFKKKVDLAAEPLTERQEKALADVGLGPPPSGVVIKRKSSILRDGDAVRVTNDLFTWIKDYKAGDTGVIVGHGTIVPEAKGDNRSRVYSVRMDKPRTKEVILLSGWELEAA